MSTVDVADSLLVSSSSNSPSVVTSSTNRLDFEPTHMYTDVRVHPVTEATGSPAMAVVAVVDRRAEKAAKVGSCKSGF